MIKKDLFEHYFESLKKYIINSSFFCSGMFVWSVHLISTIGKKDENVLKSLALNFYA